MKERRHREKERKNTKKDEGSKKGHQKFLRIEEFFVPNICDPQLCPQYLLQVYAAGYYGDRMRLDLKNEAIRVAVELRLGLDLCSTHQCQCGMTADPRSRHGLVCR